MISVAKNLASSRQGQKVLTWNYCTLIVEAPRNQLAS